ncbi:MAG: hypothetical protein RLZZ385_264 [Pseudomonadota bacterium]|jgi:16S rRNA (uracil1498-N3)-methyltransferase
MRISRIHVSQSLSSGQALLLEGDSAHYLVNVLRMKAGQACTVFNGNDGEFAATVAATGRHRVELTVGAPLASHGDPRLTICLGLGLSRGERMDWAVQKATELGVSRIVPLLTEHCEVKLDERRRENRLIHWQRIAINACEQCGRTRVPDIDNPMDLSAWLANYPQGILLDHSGTTGFKQAQLSDPVHLLIGPEGGWSDGELTLASMSGYQLVRLGPRILRTETAPVVALSVIQLLLGDLA